MNVWESIDYVSQWTKDRREKLALSQADLAGRATALLEAAGSSRVLKQQTIDQLERRTHKGVPDWFGYVRTVLDDEAEALRLARPRSSEPVPQLPEQPVAIADDIELIREVDIRLAMGEGRVVEDYPETGTVPFNRNFRRSLTSAPVEKLFIARGDGDSMMPTLINDDMVLIDLTQTSIREGEKIWALRIDDVGLIKRVRAIPGGSYELISDNSLIPPQRVKKGEIAVIGRVIWVGRRV